MMLKDQKTSIIEANRTAADTLSLDTPVGDEEDTSTICTGTRIVRA